MLPTRTVTGVFGAVTVIDGATMKNATSLTSLTGPSTHDTRTSAVVANGPVTVHGKVLDAAAVLLNLDATVSQVLPPLRDSSIRANAFTPRLWVHRMDCSVPTAHDTAVFGAATEIVGGPVATEKFASDASAVVTPPESSAVTRTRAAVVATAGIHWQTDSEPLTPMQPGTFVNVVPPFVDTLTSNEAARPAAPPDEAH